MLHVCLCYAVLPVPCTPVITCWEKAGHLALLCAVLSYVIVIGVPDQVCYLFVLIPYFAFLFTLIIIDLSSH